MRSGFDGLLQKAGPVLGLSVSLDKPITKCDNCERVGPRESNISRLYRCIEYRTSFLLLNNLAGASYRSESPGARLQDARRGSKFNPEKYELLHVTRTPKRFNMETDIKIGTKEVRPAQDIRILGVRVDSALKWKAQLRAVETHAMHTLSALQSITGST